MSEKKDIFVDLNFSKILGCEEALQQQLTLYIPNKDRDGHLIKNLKYWIEEAMKVLTIIGGGVTAMPPADGSWLDPDKNIMSFSELKDDDILWEKTRIIYAYIDHDKFVNNLHLLRNFLHSFGKETNQGEVVFEFDGRFYKIRNFD